MQDDAPRAPEGAPRKKKKKRKPGSTGTKPARTVSVPPLPPPPSPSVSVPTVAMICLAGAVLGGLFFHAAFKGGNGASATADSATANAASGPSGDNTSAPPDVAAPPADAQKTASGLAYHVLKKGDEKTHPTPNDRVRVHYSGWTQDGKLFDSSYQRGQPATFGVTQVIKGWTEGLQLMSVGEKTRFWIPGELAYGDHAGGGRPSGQLTFDVELLEIVK